MVLELYLQLGSNDCNEVNRKSEAICTPIKPGSTSIHQPALKEDPHGNMGGIADMTAQAQVRDSQLAVRLIPGITGRGPSSRLITYLVPEPGSLLQAPGQASFVTADKQQGTSLLQGWLEGRPSC